MPEFAGALNERILIERPAMERNAAGLQEQAWELVTRCRAAIVPEGAGAESEGMTLSAMPRFRVTIRHVRSIDVDQRVQWAGRHLAVRHVVADPRQKDRLVLRCEELRA